MAIGFIGMGNMGRLLVTALVRAGALQPDEVLIYSRSPEKRRRVTAALPGVQEAYGGGDLARRAGVVFLCVKPPETAGVLEEIGPYITADHLLVTINNTVTLAMLEARTPARAAKVIPSVVHAVRRGVSLLVFGGRCTHRDRALLMRLMGAVSRPFVVPEEAVRTASDLTACGPAFLSLVLHAMAEAARGKAPALSREAVMAMVRETARATCELMEQTGYDFADVAARVATPGGVAAAGVDALHPRLDGFWEAVLAATAAHEAAKRAQLVL
ncbi:NAD(P)-binding domain-containing protein [Symbiobacterium thermophilum]|uniref:Pyrroline-5-carboxylate reductase n=2 Tax=Symbiobacterium thermophilum TaxID=2734 RepID=Q67T73_SYMTH|nr:NAD(P)-binding domain-containing protein [Symbiobacterium thermophilum]BAD39120.1 ComE operon protein 4 [Symbiobacterium thermophilum IAM 14863]